jgi:tRNA A37 threonylcarbamoyladenosine modification protein TsaB
MMLFLSAQDINELVVGLVDGQSFVKEQVVESDPEQFLVEIQKVLEEWSTKFEDLTGVIVVLGPGSPTSLRVTVTIANTIGFAKQLPVVGLVNKDRVSPADLIASTKFEIPTGFKPLSPFYDRPAV